MNERNMSPELKEKVELWYNDLHKERKCNSTSIISKIVNNSSLEDQDCVRKLISDFIKKEISHCINLKEINELIILCKVINGCFDNFTHATDAVSISFNEILTFIEFCIKEFRNGQNTNHTFKYSKSNMLDLVHCLSRILVLTLKTQRTIGSYKKNALHLSANSIALMSKLSSRINVILAADEILMDTKCNFAMACLLIREIIIGDKNKMIQFHQKFLATIPLILNEKEHKLNALKFILSNAILNTWSNIVVDSSSIVVYLKFYINLCESYSSDTTMILNISRTLLILVKNECFQDFIETSKDESFCHVKSLLYCVWMLLDHPVACVRHSSKDFLLILAQYEKFRNKMLHSLSSLYHEKRSYFITLSALANESGSQSILERDYCLPKKLILAMSDPILASHVIYALESLILKDNLVKENFSEWCETWIIPLLTSLSSVMIVVAADVEKLLDILFRKYPSAFLFVLNKWSIPKNDEELRCVITALKIYNRHSLKLCSKPVCIQKEDESNSKSEKEEKKWKNLINEKLLLCCLHHNDDDIRLSAFSLTVQGLKNTEIYTEQDLFLIQYFLRYNMNNQLPSTRQKMISLMKKMIIRFSESKAAMRKAIKCCRKTDLNNCPGNYLNFENWLVDFCFCNMFDGANFNRLNTALAILLFYLENVQNIETKNWNMNSYWKKILIAIRSSYEENKIMTVALAKKLNIHKFIINGEDVVKILFKRAYELLSKMEPPNVLTGSYLMQILIEFPSLKLIAQEYLSEKIYLNDMKLFVVLILMRRLKEQVEDAKKNLISAAVNGPMYGILFAIRLIIQKVKLSEIDQNEITQGEGGCYSFNGTLKETWSTVINDLILQSFNMIHIVNCIVNSSSPEGHLPSDFHTDYNLFNNKNLILNSDDLFERKSFNEDVNESEEAILNERLMGIKLNDFNTKIRNWAEIKEDCEKLIEKFNRLFLSVTYSNAITQKNKINLIALLKDCVTLDSEINKILQENEIRNANTSTDTNINTLTISTYSQCLNLIKYRLESSIKIYVSNTCYVSRPTAQVLLLCAWRSIKEACLFLGDLLSNLEIIIEKKLITEETVMKIGQELKTLLCEIKHRGAFEQVYLGFTQLTNALWRCPQKNLNKLPQLWLQDILDQINLPREKQDMKLCSTRRSAGLPFLIQAIISSELQHVKSSKIQTLEVAMKTLFEIAEREDSNSQDSKIHALNILRAIFKHSLFGEHVAPYVSRALMIAIQGSRAPTWSERNSSSLLFSSLVIRIFGVARNKDSLSKKNRMTNRTFFQRYPELYDFFLNEMKLALRENNEREYYPRPNLILILLILGRFYPALAEDHTDCSEFLFLINISCCDSTLKIRELSARALVSMIIPEKLKLELESRFSLLFQKELMVNNNNRIHGILLQLRNILVEMLSNQTTLLRVIVREKGLLWIENTEWILNSDNEAKKVIPYFIKLDYIHILHLIFKSYPDISNDIEKIVNKWPDDALNLSIEKSTPGYFVFMESLYYLKLDIVVHTWMEFGNIKPFIQLQLSMFKNQIEEIQAIPLRFLLFIFSDKMSESIEEDNIKSICLQIEELRCLQNENIINVLKAEPSSYSTITKYIVKLFLSFLLNIQNEKIFVYKMKTRLLLSSVSSFLLHGIVTVKEMYSFCQDLGCFSILKLDSFSYLLNCGDLDISVNTFILYSVCFFENIINGFEKISEFVLSFSKLFFNFSHPDADVKQRAGASKIFNKYYHVLNHKFFLEDSQALSIWMLPLRLMVDDDPFVRRNTMLLVPKFHDYLTKHVQKQKLLIQFQEMSSFQLSAIPLRSQEYLLDFYINLFGEENLLHLIVQMVIWSLTACFNMGNYENVSEQNETGVFEKGNPNPFCEEMSFSNLMCNKLHQLNEIIDLKCLLKKKLSASHTDVLKDFFPTLTLPTFPSNLHELVEKIYKIFAEADSDHDCRTLSLLHLQIHELYKCLLL